MIILKMRVLLKITNFRQLFLFLRTGTNCTCFKKLTTTSYLRRDRSHYQICQITESIFFQYSYFFKLVTYFRPIIPEKSTWLRVVLDTLIGRYHPTTQDMQAVNEELPEKETKIQEYNLRVQALRHVYLTRLNAGYRYSC